ncbi:hypothetical protein FQN54_000239 [Arachnomyces sp. PD_36]|nr:hypothetical protein FQN54_000239 [Arachnomyces sp. PD_36]
MVETVKQLSINDVVAGGVKLSLLLNAVACDITSSPGIDPHGIAKAVSLFALSLQQIGRGFQAVDSLHTGDGLSTARKIAVQGRVIFDEIELMLDKARGTGGYPVPAHLSTSQRFSQSFKPHRVEYLLAHLESLQLSLTVMSLVFQIGRSMVAQRYGDGSRRPPTNDTIQQERVDAQNMVVVRHCAVNRLSGLYGLCKREAYLTHNDENPSAGKRPENPTLSEPPYQIPVIPLVEFRNSPSSLNGSPSDMARESAKLVDQLISLWVRLDAERGGPSGARPANEPRGSDRNPGRASQPNLRGGYMGGTSNEWRDSPSSRKSASHLRDRYRYQPRIDSDSDSSDDRRSSGRSRRRHGDFYDTTDPDTSTDDLRSHRRGKPVVQKKTRFAVPDTGTRSGTQVSRSDSVNDWSTAPQFHRNSTRGPVPTYQQQQSRGGAAYHPAPFPSNYQNQHQRQPPLYYERPERRSSSSSRHSRRGSSSSRDDRSRYDDLSREERHRRLKRNATKGILGIGTTAF